MIDFRYHIVSLVAVFLALAVGIALGAGPLQAAPAPSTTTSSSASGSDLRSQLATLTQQANADESFISTVAPLLEHGRLAGTRAVVVAMPGTTTDLTTGVAGTLRAAGAEVSGTVSLRAELFDPTRAGYLDDLVTRLGSPVPASAGPADRALAAVAAALVTRSARTDNGQPNTAAAQLIAGLEQLNLVTATGDPATRATLAVVVSGVPPAQPTQAETNALARAVSFLGQLRGVGRGTVVVGTAPTARPGGLLAAVRDGGSAVAQVSTVDDMGTSAGGVTLVFAAAEQLAGGSGAYGTGSGAQAVLPDLTSAAPVGTPSPSPSGS